MCRVVTLFTVLALAAPLHAADPLDDGLFEKAKDTLAALKKKGATNVGVVKFLVRHADGPERDDAGDLNLTLANKLEVALILANTDDRFGIIDKASEQVVREKLLGANHRTAEGRKAFFARKYELAWSRDKVEPAAFLTGVATISADFTKLTIRLQVFDKSGEIEDIGESLAANTNPELLAQAGFSYALASTRQKAIVAGDALPTPETLQREILEQVAKGAGPASAQPSGEPSAALAACPVKWDVLYNGKSVPITGHSIPEPKPTDRVEFTLTNTGTGTYAVVLLVNGENTLYQERATPRVCRKWVLTPGSTVTIRGFQTGPNTTAPFEVLPPEEPMPDAVRYSDHAGTFRLVVFHGKMSATDPATESIGKGKPDEAIAQAMSRTRGDTRPAGVKPQTLKALQADLRGRTGTDGARGYVIKSEKTEKFETTAVFFTPSPELPVADVSLRYFTPKK